MESPPPLCERRRSQYTLHEINIGSTAYDASADTDGYRDYFVTYDPTKYRKGDTGDYGELAYWPDNNGVYQYADHALLNVHNRLDNGTVLVFFSQIWKDNVIKTAFVRKASPSNFIKTTLIPAKA